MIVVRLVPQIDSEGHAVELAPIRPVKWEWGFANLRANEHVLGVLEGHERQVKAVCWSPDSRRLVSASWDGTVRVWHVTSRDLIATLDCDGDPLNAVTFDPVGRRFAAGGEGAIRVWGADDYSLRLEIPIENRAVNDVQFSPDGQLIASAHADHTTQIWNAATGQAVGSLHGHRHSVHAVAFHPDGQSLVSASSDNSIRIWDGFDGDSRVLGQHTNWARDVEFSPDASRCISGGADRRVRIWAYQTGASLRMASHGQGVNSVSCSPDNERIASGGTDGRVRIWDAHSAELNATLLGHTDWIMDVSYSPDGRLLASCGSDNSIRVWHPEPPEFVSIVEGHEGWVWDIVFGPDDRWFAGHSDSVMAMSVSGDGTSLATADRDGTIRLWSMPESRPITNLGKHDRAAYDVAFSPRSSVRTNTSQSFPWSVGVRPEQVRSERPRTGVDRRHPWLTTARSFLAIRRAI